MTVLLLLFFLFLTVILPGGIVPSSSSQRKEGPLNQAVLTSEIAIPQRRERKVKSSGGYQPPKKRLKNTGPSWPPLRVREQPRLAR